MSRQDRQDKQETSSAFPDEKQKDLLSIKLRIACSSTGVMRTKLARSKTSFQDELFVSFIRKPAKAPVDPVNPV